MKTSKITITSSSLKWLEEEIPEFEKIGYTVTKSIYRPWFFPFRFRAILERGLLWYDLKYIGRKLYPEVMKEDDPDLQRALDENPEIVAIAKEI